MAEIDVKLDVDLEDGEIESDSEPTVEAAVPEKPTTATEIDPQAKGTAVKENKDKDKDKNKIKERERQLSELLKKSPNKPEKKKPKEHYKKPKDHKPEKTRSYSSDHIEDDFAGSIEKAIKKELNRIKENQNLENADSGVEDSDSKRKHKKRKKHDYPEKESSSKKKKLDETAPDEEVDEDEMMCIRGASPVHRQNRSEENYVSEEENASFLSDDSDKEYGHGRDRTRNRNFTRRGGVRDIRNDRFRQRFDRHRIDKHPLQDPDGVCLFYMQGKCYKGDDCAYSHDARPPRKMELCKFYLMDCCAKRDKCLYLHSDFPCKYFHTGLPCPNKHNCKFSHGKPLTEDFKLILLKHIESAPKEILGDFPRLNRESASLMLTNTQNRLKQQYTKNDNEDKSDQSPSDQTFRNEIQTESNQSEILHEANSQSKSRKSKVRQSRWRDPSPVRTPNMTAAAENILSIQNLNGVLTPNQISDLIQMGITNLNQLSQLTVIQLNQLGITVNQINEIQLNTLNIQKLGLIDNNAAPTSNLLLNKVKLNTDFDMRVSPGVGDMTATSIPAKQTEPMGKDVDMRFQSNDTDVRDDLKKQKTSLDIDQYTKDALNFNIMNKDTNLNSIHINDASQSERKEAESDVDHRVLNYVREASIANVKLTNEEDILSLNENDTDIRLNSLPMKQQEMFLPMQKKNEERSRRPTTDDEDDSLQIDEKWYSSDEEQTDKTISKIKSPPQHEKDSDSSRDKTEPNTVLKNLGDLSKIDISAEVTKLLTTIKSSTENASASKKDYLKSRDPRNLPKSSSEHKEAPGEGSKKISHKPEFVSIYDCIENSNPETTRRRTDVDLRPSKDVDFRMPSFGDTDLRQTPGGTDVDLRLGLPLKLLPNYTPATEIDGSIGSHAPIAYKVYSIDIPRPDYTDIKNTTHKSQAAGDPRLRKIFRLSTDEPTSDTEKPAKVEKPAPPVRSDPRKRTIECNENSFISKPAPLDIQVIIQTSEWYKNLSSNQKILTNQQLATVTSNLKKFHADKTTGKKFDLSDIKSNNILCMIFSNLGVFLDENGDFFRLNPQDSLIPNIPPKNFNQNPDMFMGNMMDNMNMMNMNNSFINNMGPINNMNHMLPVNNYDPRFSGGDPRTAPGILGMPPNNFDHLGMSNYNNDNYNNMNYDNAYDGPGNNGNDYMMDEMDDDYYRDHKNDYKNSYRGGRNNDRWNRGRPRGGNSGNSGSGRDRRGYTERGGWKNDRR